MSPPVILASMGAVVAATFSATYLLTRCECQEPAPCEQAWKAPPGSKFTASFDPTLDPKQSHGARIYWGEWTEDELDRFLAANPRPVSSEPPPAPAPNPAAPPVE